MGDGKGEKYDLIQRAGQLMDFLVEWRRDFHAFPELSFQERRTSEKIVEVLSSLQTFVIEKNVGGHGIIASVTCGEGPVVGIRADMDALPIVEESSAPWASKHPGVMHACGHDAHLSILLGIAQLVAEDAKAGRFQGTIQLIFQPAEEACDEKGETGAVKMLASGKLDRLDAVMALHMCPWKKTNELQWNDGPSMANNDEFHLRIQGVGGHAGYPQHVKDPIWMATTLLQILYSLNGRKTNPLEVGTISVGQVHAGDASNVIPSWVDIKGTLRSYKDNVRESLSRELHQAANVITALGGEYTLRIDQGEPSLINDPRINRVFLEVAKDLQVYEEPFGMGSEDFSHFTRKVPGAMFFLGCGLGRERSLHQSDFDIDERSMPIGVRVLLQSAYRILEQGGIEQ